MSNQEMNEGAEGGGPQNTRKGFEELLEGNRQSAVTVLGLVRQVGNFLFGPKPTEAGEDKEKAKSVDSFFERTRGVAIETRLHLDRIKDELGEIIKELK